MRSSILALVLSLLGGAALADIDEACRTADHLVHADFALPKVAAAIADKRLNVVVLGSGSSALGGPTWASKAYPGRFEAALVEKLPGVQVKVTTYAKPRQSAADMEKEIEKVLAADKPALVVWQTGTADAIGGIDPEEFRASIDDGVDALHAGSADVVLMNMQYSPRTESMIALNAYADAMRFVALQRNVNLFDRFSIMKHWNELGTFDFYAATKKMDLAERVHSCIGRMLARMVLEGTSLTASENKENH
jgi:lysophospholipase L1-like esterase